jgi:dTDP-4-dehydrorhamnose 3,5-epimerase
MRFTPGIIDGITWKPLAKFGDSRGWLCELFRHDEMDGAFHPTMAYASVTEPGVTRGPHEHVEQADYFCFFGPADFKLYLWDMRPGSATFGIVEVEVVGASNPVAVIVPPGIVHAYRNVSELPGLVINCPNRLYRGRGKAEPVDEIRYEGRDDSPFVMEEDWTTIPAAEPVSAEVSEAR